MTTGTLGQAGGLVGDLTGDAGGVVRGVGASGSSQTVARRSRTAASRRSSGRMRWLCGSGKGVQVAPERLNAA